MEWLNQNAALVIGIILALINIGGWVWTKFNQAYKIKRSDEIFHNTVENHTKQISDMDIRHKEDYFKLDGKLDNLTDALNGFIDISKRSTQVILRDKIYSIYKDTLKKGYILEKDSRNLSDMIKSYKENNGNSYVCDEIEPRMKDFKVFCTDEDYEEYFKKSR
jgi:DNA-binding transcriptional regulator of glucitol operon